MKVSLISLIGFYGSLGLRYISSSLRQAGHNTEMIFLNLYEQFNPDLLFSTRILQELTELVKESDLIAVSCMSAEFNKSIQVINYLKKLNKPIIWGGIHATSCPDECIKYADIVCIGEGEEAICELLATMERGSDFINTKNFWFRENGQVIKNPVRPLIQNLDSLPSPDYDSNTHYILNGGALIKANGVYKNTITRILIHTIRGCPFNCSYCCNSYLKQLYLNKGKYTRKMSTEAIIEELQHYKDKFPNLKAVWFTDDDMLFRTIKELKFLTTEYKEKIGLPFMCYVNPATVTEEKFELLVNAGLYRAEVGVQTGSEDISKNLYNRNISKTKVIKAAQLLNKYKMKMGLPYYHIMYQNPYETEKDLIKTIALLKELPPPFFLQCFPIQFFPTSTLYEKAKCDAILKDNIFVNYHDDKKAFELNNKEKYLNFLVYLMSGTVTSRSIGRIPRVLIPILTNRKTINYFKRHEREVTSLINDYFNIETFHLQKLRRKMRKYKIVGKLALNCISSDLRQGQKGAPIKGNPVKRKYLSIQKN